MKQLTSGGIILVDTWRGHLRVLAKKPRTQTPPGHLGRGFFHV